MITFKSFSDFTPLEFKYNFSKNEILQIEPVTTREGLKFNNLNAFLNFKDVAINKNTCLLLTSAISLSSFFANSQELVLGNLPGSIILQSKNNDAFYIGYDANENMFVTSTQPAIFLLYPVNDREVEVKVNGKFLQIDSEYPFIARLNEISLTSANINRQRFTYMYQNNTLTLRTLTKVGYRYLAMTKDQNLKAAGLNLNNATLHHYAFRVFNVTTTNYNFDFSPLNTWVTYFQDFGSQINNETVAINKEFSNVPTNFLINFSLDNSIDTGTANINIANLKTSFTPAGGPTPIDNTYTEPIITTN